MGRSCLFAYTGLTDRFRRVRGFLYNLASLLKLIRSEKNSVLIQENLFYDEEPKQFSKQKTKSALSERKNKEKSKNYASRRVWSICTMSRH